MSVKLDIDMPKACIEYHAENDERIYCPIYNSCKQRLTINLNGKPNNCPLRETDDEIKVGDEVTVNGVKGIAVREPYAFGEDNEPFVLIWYGWHMSSNRLKTVAPTGRHFPQIAEVLEQMKGE